MAAASRYPASIPSGSRLWLTALAVLVLATGCGTRVEFRDPTIAEVAVGAAKGALESTLLGSPVPVGAVTGAAGTLVEVRGPVYSQFPGRPNYRGSCPELRDCVFSGR